MNDLAVEINELECGINIDNTILSLLLYADDIALTAPSADKLQTMLGTVNKWCNKWRLTVNTEQTKVVQFRPPSTTLTTYTYTCGDRIIENTNSYKYLGLWLNEHLNMTKSVNELAKSAGRALSALDTKCLRAVGMTLSVFEKLYQSLVEPVLFYAAGVWGTTEHKSIQVVQHKACRYFLGGGKHAANVSLRVDMGWNSCYVKAKLETFRLWLKLERTDDGRVLKNVHIWSKQYTRGWESRITKLANELNVMRTLKRTLKNQ